MNRLLYRTLLLFAATLLAVWAFLLVLSPFLAAIAWALCLAAVTWRPYLLLRRRLGRRRLAAFIMVFATVVAILLPMVIVTALLGQELVRLGRDIPGWVATLEQRLPDIHAWLDQQLRQVGVGGVRESAQRLADAAPEILWRPLARGAWDVLGGLFGLLMGLAIMFATQYFLYTDGNHLAEWLRGMLPIHRSDADRILETLRKTTSAALLGGVVVALVQGILGGIGYAWAGLDAPVLWGVLTAVFSLLPVGGSALVWVPIVIYLFAVGQTGVAIPLTLWCFIAVSGIDNVLRPWLLRRAGSNVHPLLLFFAILSGIGLFGMSGIVFGPLLIAFLVTIAQIYRERIAQDAPPARPPSGA